MCPWIHPVVSVQCLVGFQVPSPSPRDGRWLDVDWVKPIGGVSVNCPEESDSVGFLWFLRRFLLRLKEDMSEK